MGIDFKINFNTKINIDGKEYGSVEEVPEEHRQTIKNAMGSAGTAHSKIMVNGVGYDSLEAMPPDLRDRYKEAFAKAKALTQPANPLPQEPRSFHLKVEGPLSGRTITILALLAGLAILLKFLAPH